jgi:hypothetical protein
LLPDLVSAGTVAILAQAIYELDYVVLHHGDDWSAEYRASVEEGRRRMAGALEILEGVRSEADRAKMDEMARMDVGSKGKSPWLTY